MNLKRKKVSIIVLLIFIFIITAYLSYIIGQSQQIGFYNSTHIEFFTRYSELLVYLSSKDDIQGLNDVVHTFNNKWIHKHNPKELKKIIEELEEKYHP